MACVLSYSYLEPQSTADALMRLLLTRKGGSRFLRKAIEAELEMGCNARSDPFAMYS